MTAATAYRLLNGAIVAILLLLAAGSARAQDWPAKTVRIVVPFGPGSTPDIVARLVADGLQQKYPASAFVVENKPGASGNIGTDVVAKAAPDGSTLGVSIGGPLAINTLLFAKLPYDPQKDIAPVTQLVTQPSVLAVNPSLGVNSVVELVALLRKNPRKYNFASIGIGSLSHLAMEAIAIKGGAELVHVPYTSSPQAITAVIRNDAQNNVSPGNFGNATGGSRRGQNSCRLNRPALALFTGCTDPERGRYRCGSRRLERLDCPWRHTQTDHR